MALPVPSNSVNKSSDICTKGYYLLWTLFILQLISCATCLFEDQIGKFDWRQHYIGKLKFATFDAVASTKKIFVATEQNVIAALNPKSGQPLWRQVLERDDAGHIQHLHAGSELISISGGPFVYVRAWDLNKGFLLWEWTLSQQISKDAKWIVDQKRLYHVVPIENAFIEVSAFNVATGADLGTRKLPADWLNEEFSCAVASTKYICVTKDKLHWADVLDSTTIQQVSLAELGLSVSSPQILAVGSSTVSIVTSDGQQQVLSVNSGGFKPISKLDRSATICSTSVNSEPAILKAESDGHMSSLSLGAISINNGKELLELSATMKLPELLKGSPQKLEAATCTDKGCRVLLSGADHTISLVHHPGKVMWTREEALASIITAEIMDLPVSDTDAAIEKEFDNKEAGFVGMFVRRISSQLLQLRLSTLAILGVGVPSTSQKSSLVRDEFGLHKMIVVASSAGKVFGIDNLSGELLWQLRIPEVVPFKVLDQNRLLMFVLRTTSHVPFPAECALLGKHKETGEGYAVLFNPITGRKHLDIPLGYTIRQVIQLPHPDEEFLRGLIILDDTGRSHVLPETSLNNALSVASSTYIYTADQTSGLLTGFSLALSKNKELTSIPVWEIKLPELEQLVAVAGKHPAERVHSQGRVLGDRNVLYKYLNPNLVAIITHSIDPVHKHLLNVYLIDAVSGAVVFSVSHKRAKGPVHMVHSENWVVYSFYNDKSRRTEIATLELYEGKSQYNSTAFSSLASPIQPIVERQAFIMPVVIESMRETITEKGITSKHILMALSGGSILQLPWMFVDPRRPVVVSAEMRDEGVIPYVPELPVPPDAIINYNLTVQRIRGIHTAPSGLESTCLVLAYGLDLFYTRVAPSKTFDLLKDDFDHFLISAVLLGLVIASYVTKRLASRKALKQAWK